MSWEHERVEELLAVHALGGLDPADAELAERAIAEHLPGCDACRRAWDDYRVVASDLALAAPAMEPPETLEVRIRRRVEERPRRTMARTLGAAAAAILIGVTAATAIRSLDLADRVSAAERQEDSLFGALRTISHPSKETVEMADGPEMDRRVAAYYVPGERRMFIVAEGLPRPRHAYHVWCLGSSGSWHGGVLRVENGHGMLQLRTDPEKWDAILLTDERVAGPSPHSSPLLSGDL